MTLRNIISTLQQQQPHASLRSHIHHTVKAVELGPVKPTKGRKKKYSPEAIDYIIDHKETLSTHELAQKIKVTDGGMQYFIKVRLPIILEQRNTVIF